MEKTITYSEAVQGWVSFYSYFPDWITGMNNHLYTWSGGQLYRHNSNNVNRCNFYGQDYPSSLKTVFNEFPLDNKIFKTIAIIGDDPWDILSMYTDLQSGGNIDASWFEEKESSFFAYVRSTNDVPATIGEYPLRSLNGIGRSSSVTGTGAAVTINFALSVSIGSIISVGDYLYYVLTDTPILAGRIDNVQIDYPNGINRIIIDTTIIGGSVPPGQTDYFLYVKNQVAESLGMLGHYCVVQLENNNTDKVELFVLESETMKSFP